MRAVEHFTVWMTDLAGRRHRSRWKMTREEAALRGAEVIENTVETYWLPETEQDMQRLIPGVLPNKRLPRE